MTEPSAQLRATAGAYDTLAVCYADFARDALDRLPLDRAVLAATADVGQTGEEPWHVLADPEGNEFCLLKARIKAL